MPCKLSLPSSLEGLQGFGIRSSSTNNCTALSTSAQDFLPLLLPAEVRVRAFQPGEYLMFQDDPGARSNQVNLNTMRLKRWH